MKRSVDRILTTHTGSLPRPEKLVELMFAKEEGREVGERVLADLVRSSVREVVERQQAAGIDIVSDGEMSKPSYATYVTERLTGFGGESLRPGSVTSSSTRTSRATTSTTPACSAST